MPLVNLMLDSGAYSAWNHGEEIDIDKYIAFIKLNLPYVETYVNLDQIPGKRGQKFTQADVERSAQVSYDNLQYMKSHGLSPIPVFHQGERFYWLERLVADGETYIGISPHNDLRTAAHIDWLDKVYTIITDADGRALVKTHGFAVTTASIMFRYPWYSVDSTTWALVAGYGKIYVPEYNRGKPCYDRPPIGVVLSGRKQSSGSLRSYQYEMLGPTAKAYVDKFLAEEVGTTLLEARFNDVIRYKALIIYFQKLAAARPEVLFQHRRKSLIE